MNVKKSRHNVAHAEELFAETIDGHNHAFTPGAHALLQFSLSKEQREAIYQIRSAAAGQGQIDQCERLVEMLASWLLDDEQKTALAANPLNCFYLFASIYLNNIEDIVENRQVFGITELSHAQAISEIVRTCRQPPEEWRHTQPPIGDDQSSEVRMDLLSAALALAERLDLHHPRTLTRIRRRLETLARPVVEHWPEEFRVEGSGPHPHQPGAVLIRIHCRDSRLHSALKHYETNVDRFLCRLNRMIRPRFLFSRVCFEIKADGYEPMDFKFAVDSSAALQLFMGNTLYGDKRVFLRELVQNAVDACHLRSLLQPGYTPAISIDLNAAEDRITIRDNGIGMDREWLEKYFLNVGVSYYRSGELDAFAMDSNPHLDFISNFGIGFLSTFLIARRITVHTRKSGSEGLLITITDIGDYFDVRRDSDCLPIGTEVVLELKSSRIKLWRSMEFLGYLKSTARFVSIPIHFTDAEGNTTVIGCEPLDSFSSNISGQNFSAVLQVSPSQGCLLMRTRGGNDRMYGLDAASGGISIFQDGIFVTQITDILPEKARTYVVGRLNLLGKHKCELSMDRNRIFWPPHHLQFLRRAVLHAIAEATGKMLEEADHRTVAAEVRRKMEQTVASFFELTTVDDMLFGSLHPRIRQLLRQHFRSFLRTSISKTDSPGRDLSAIAAAQGFQYKWQRSVIAGMVQ